MLRDGVDYYYQADVSAVAELLGKLRDKEAKDVLLKVIQSPRWRSARPKAVAAIMEIFGEEAGAILKPVLEKLPADPPRTALESS